MTKWIITGSFVVVEAHTEIESVEHVQQTSSRPSETEPWSPTCGTTEHRPSVTLRADVFPEEAVLPADYTPEQVAREAWLSITEWVKDGYQPLLTVRMEDGTEHIVDLGRTP